MYTRSLHKLDAETQLLATTLIHNTHVHEVFLAKRWKSETFSWVDGGVKRRLGRLSQTAGGEVPLSSHHAGGS